MRAILYRNGKWILNLCLAPLLKSEISLFLHRQLVFVLCNVVVRNKFYRKINKMRWVSACLKLFALIVPVKCFDPLFKYLIHFSKLFFINTCRFVALRQNEGWHVVELTCSHFYHPLPPSEKGMEYHEPI